jgi:hypothetical protein
VIIETRMHAGSIEGTREICGAKMKKPPRGHGHLICDNEPRHLPPTSGGPAVHVARDPGGMMLGSWKEGD